MAIAVALIGAGHREASSEILYYNDFADDELVGMTPEASTVARIVDGSLQISRTGFARVTVDGLDLADVSVRTQLRMLQPVTAITGLGISTLRSTSGQYWALFDDEGDSLSGIDGRGVVSADTGFDITGEDTMLQLDVFDGVISFWAWKPGDPMPSEPTGVWEDFSLGSGTVSLWVNNLDSVPVVGAFRFIEVADAHIEDPVPGDFNRDRLLNTDDIDRLTLAVRETSTDHRFDLNRDGSINDLDRTVWVKDLKATYFGDTDLDGEFKTSDLVLVLASGTYGVDVDSTWSTGDFNGNGRTESNDVVVAFADGGFNQGPRQAAAVPEPASALLLALGLLSLSRYRGMIL